MAVPRAQCQTVGLYPGERVEQLAGYPAMVRFFKGDPQKPLLVFVPGSHHLARIIYGHPGSRPADFLAYWLQKKGYNVLAISYPVVTEHAVFDKPYPDFTAQAWGEQIALAAQQAIQENGLTKSVVLLHWSMAGKAVEPATQASRKLGLEVEAAISMAATPGFPKDSPGRLPMALSGNVHKDDNYADWLSQLADDAADNNGRTIIPPAIYTSEYVGDMTVNLQGDGQVYRNGAFVQDSDAQSKDYGTFAVNRYPLVAVLMDSKPADAAHALGDPSAWAFYNGRTVSRVGSTAARTLSPEKWRALLQLERAMDHRLRTPVGGNHFFFVGEKGAQTAATAIDLSIRAVSAFKADWTAITGQPFN